MQRPRARSRIARDVVGFIDDLQAIAVAAGELWSALSWLRVSSARAFGVVAVVGVAKAIIPCIRAGWPW